MGAKIWCGAAVAVLGLGVLAGCDDRLAMQPARDHRAGGEAVTELAAGTGAAPGGGEASVQARPASYSRGDEGAAARPAAGPVRMIQGAPMWSDSRRYSAEQNAQYQFEHHAGDLGARDLDDFLLKAHRFVSSPAQGTLTLTRANGDRLMFDPKSQLFAVARSDGAPRTVFKPEGGRAYWDQQVASQGERPAARRTAARDRDDQG